MFKDALTRVSILSTDKYKGIRVTIDKSVLKIQAFNPEQEKAEEELEVDYTGENISMGFNVGYLLDILSAVDCPSIKLEFSSSNSSILIRPVENNVSIYVYSIINGYLKK